jgi:Fic family protein
MVFDMANRAGKRVNQLSGEYKYQSFSPTPLQEVRLEAMDGDFQALLAKTSRLIGRIDGFITGIPDIDLFISLYVRKEALLSSQIEGTQATLDDILDPEADHNHNMNVSEVLNYIKAADFAMERMNELPLCLRLLRETHEVLLSGIRGSEKNPGEFRRSQNWIGPTGSTLKTASFIPPSVEDMNTALGELEKYINMDETDPDVLIRAALIHYQFETIHPFLDGNGRIGRLLIILYLIQKQILQKPVLYISYFLKLNRQEYYDRLSAVRNNGNYEQWVKFFIQALYQTADDALTACLQLIALREKNRQKIAELGRSAKSARQGYDYIERSPIIDIRKTSNQLKLPFTTVSRAVEHLRLLGILQLTETVKRNRCFAYEEYLAILRKDT